MSNNRLFIYDPLNGTACPLAKGGLYGWYRGNDEEHLNKWFDDNDEVVNIEHHTRYQLCTEEDLPAGVLISWAEGQKVYKPLCP